MAKFFLKDERRTADFGKLIAWLLPRFDFPPLLMRGDLGSGKTALARAIVNNMKNGEFAEVSSPSFTICNQYPTIPPCLHCDLYRCKGDIPEDITETLENGKILLLVEWAEYFPAQNLPKDYLDIFFNIVNYSRLLNIDAKGPGAEGLLRELARKWPARA